MHLSGGGNVGHDAVGGLLRVAQQAVELLLEGGRIQVVGGEHDAACDSGRDLAYRLDYAPQQDHQLLMISPTKS